MKSKTLEATTKQEEQIPSSPKRDNTGTAARDAAYVAVRRAGGSPRAAVRAYCAGNKWATENAKGVGNW